MRSLYGLLLATLLLTGCSGGGKQAEEPVQYLLRAGASVPSGVQQAPISIGINRIAIADYLGQPGIVVATGGDKIRPARQHRWAEPLDSSLRLFLRDAISARLGYPISADTGRRLGWDYRVDVHIDEWHGSLAGDVQLVAEWVLIEVANDSEVARHRFEQRGALAADGYDALVAAQVVLLESLAAAIATSLGSIPAPETS